MWIYPISDKIEIIYEIENNIIISKMENLDFTSIIAKDVNNLWYLFSNLYSQFSIRR